MNDQFVLRTTAHWKALAHPLRASIIRLLTEHPMTNEQMAEALCLESGKLYFHTKQLFDAGMIEIIETRAKGSVIEKVYQAVARQFITEGLPDDPDRDEPVFGGLISDALWLYRHTWQEWPEMRDKAHYAFHFTHPISAEKSKEFVRRMQALAAEFQDGRTDDEDATIYSFAMLLHATNKSDSPESR